MQLTKPQSKTEAAKALGMARSSIYYEHKQPIKDFLLKQEIEKVLREFPSYGHKRIAEKLDRNKKSVLRVMKIFGIKPYRRRGKKWRKQKKKELNPFSNLLLEKCPTRPNHIWASDFTHLAWKGKTVYLATIIDLFTREVVGFSVLLNHSVQLVMNALLAAIHKHPVPEILHSDQGSEYLSKAYVGLAEGLGIRLSMSHAGCPWENGYQESFYSHFKIDFGDPNRFNSLGELVYEIYRTIYIYNNQRIHSALRMPPIQFANQFLTVERVSEKRGT